MKHLVPVAVSRKVGRATLLASKHSPTILFAAGVVGFGATVVLAAKATLKVDEVLERHEKKSLEIDLFQGPSYTEKDRKQDKVILYTQTTLGLVKLYAPAVAVGGLSIAALTGSHHILNKRNAALTAAYAGVEKAFNQYRERVRNELGDDKDREFRYGTIEVKETVEGKNGPEIKTTKQLNPYEFSMYARVFDVFNPNWQGRADYNRMFLNSVQNHMNDRLRYRGHVFLNEVYDALGMERSKAGSVVGWSYAKNKDSVVDLGFMDIRNPQTRLFINGDESAVMLDFNVDGVIFDELTDEER